MDADDGLLLIILFVMFGAILVYDHWVRNREE